LRCANGDPVRLGELICEKGGHITTIIVFGMSPPRILPPYTSPFHCFQIDFEY
jgi:hypothetical protein